MLIVLGCRMATIADDPFSNPLLMTGYFLPGEKHVRNRK
jgi:hypothetical protein